MKHISYILLALLLFSCFNEENEPEEGLDPILQQKVAEVQNAIYQEAVEVSGASFILGNQPSNQQTAYVLLSPFKVMQTKVTNDMYVTFLNDIGCGIDGKLYDKTFIHLSKDTSILASFNPETNKVDFNTSQPDSAVHAVSWFGANAFCIWAGAQLPTEAEISYLHQNVSNFKSEFKGSEWCFDWYTENIDADSIRVNPIGPSEGAQKVVQEYVDGLVVRGSELPGSSRLDLGFRCVWAYEAEITSIAELGIGKIASLTSTSISIETAITNNGGDENLSVGVIWDTQANPNFQKNLGLVNAHQSDDIFSVKLVGLKPATTYYLRCFALNGLGITYGEVLQTKTLEPLLGAGGGILEIEMVPVASGVFQMGDNDQANIPAHEVELDAFMMSKFEITVQQYCEFANALGLNNNGNRGEASYFNPSDLFVSYSAVNGFTPKTGFENYPISRVTWQGASAFCTWAGGKLPSEAQWEFAARGGNASNFSVYAGSSQITEVAWYYENSSNYDLTLLDGKAFHSVGQRKPNELGLHDMSGNVYEWCSDYFDLNYYQSSPYKNPTGPATGDRRVIRGGSFIDDEFNCRVYTRDSKPPEEFQQDYLIGFRMVVE